jgi:hypothetical protein
MLLLRSTVGLFLSRMESPTASHLQLYIHSRQVLLNEATVELEENGAQEDMNTIARNTIISKHSDIQAVVVQAVAARTKHSFLSALQSSGYVKGNV